MPRSIVRLLTLLALPALGYACGGTDDMPADPGADAAARAQQIVIVKGAEQRGRTGMWFEGFLSVQVTDAEGHPLKGVPVQWSVAHGPLEVSQELSTTNRFGRTQITARAQPELGTGVIRAQVQGKPDLSADFEETVTAYQVIMKSDQYSEMTFQSELVVQVGDTIEWLNKDMADTHGGEYAMHTATSISEPPGGVSFDSDKLMFDETFQWVPNTTGRWEYHCDDHPQSEEMYGTIKVVERKKPLRSGS